MQPSPGSFLLQLALQLPPPAQLTGPHGVLAALMLHASEVSVVLLGAEDPLHPSLLLQKTFHTRFAAVFENRKAIRNWRLIFWTPQEFKSSLTCSMPAAYKACGACRKLWHSSDLLKKSFKVRRRKEVFQVFV